MSPFWCRALLWRRVLPLALALFVGAGCGSAESGDGDPEGPQPSTGGIGGAPGAGGAAGTGGDEPIAEAPCEEVLIVNLNPDGDDADSCARFASIEATADCVAERIEATFDPYCRQAFDVFVPGTAAEYGAWKQFNYMFSRDSGRAYLSLQYAGNEDPEGLDNLFDASQYDKGVIDGTSSLVRLLYALQNRFIGSDVRVFGHSKGSHIVSLASDFPEFAAMRFFAFAQAGRTSTDISDRNDIGAGKRGRPGRIEKLSANLVGITWENDEVQYYRGQGTNGLAIPERWSFPGYVFQSSYDGGNPLGFRIDHHNNYGGSYIDGLSDNDWRQGDGTRKTQYPYCATGNSLFFGYAECAKQTVGYVPYFWGSEDCRNLAFDLMDEGLVGDFHYIGHSGPRANGCTEQNRTVEADFVMEYRINNGDLDDDDCLIEIEVGFEGLDGRPDGGSFSVQTSQNEDTGWRTRRGVVRLPVHMLVRVTKTITDISGIIRDCGGFAVLANTETWIRGLAVNFIHPEKGQRVNRTLIGLEEGASAVPFPASLSRQNNTAWYEDVNNGNDIDIHYSPTRGSILFEADNEGGVDGTFYKRVHLLD